VLVDHPAVSVADCCPTVRDVATLLDTRIRHEKSLRTENSGAEIAADIEQHHRPYTERLQRDPSCAEAADMGYGDVFADTPKLLKGWDLSSPSGL
jgi:hypothetical protein